MALVCLPLALAWHQNVGYQCRWELIKLGGFFGAQTPFSISYSPPPTPPGILILGTILATILATGTGEALLTGDLPHFENADWRN